MSITRFALPVLLVISLNQLVTGCSRSENDELVQQVSVTGDALPPGHAAMRATIDPETGKLTVEASPGRLPLDPETREALRRDTEGLREIHHPDGSVSVDLMGRFQSASVARIGADGKVTVCTQDADGAERALDASSRGHNAVEVQ